ncbi:hypothetical protein HDU96_009397 [Phlyctochytrium bullatum]|nr:hypothetical protein HDU96_009397 [Phlyctochytrium bullatum]
MHESSVSDIHTLPLGRPALPNELLRCVIFYLHPNVLPVLGAANRHLRLAVPASIGPEFAKRHLSQLNKRHEVERLGYMPPWGFTYDESFMRSIRFQHPLLLDYAVAMIALNGTSTLSMWAGKQAKASADKVEAWRAWRVKAVLSAVQRGIWPARTPQLAEDLRYATRMAAQLRCTRLMDDLRQKFPESFQDGLQSELFRCFFSECMRLGFVDGLRLIPPHHPILSAPDERGRTMLQSAVLDIILNKPAVVQVLLELGAPVNPVSPVAESPAANSLAPNVDVGVAASPAPSPPDKRSPLLCAVVCGHTEIVRKLLTHGADASVRHTTGMPVLHVAAKNNMHDIVALLVAHGADMTATIDWGGFTALQYAAFSGNSKAVRAMLDAGADVEDMGRGDKTPVCVACSMESYEAAAMLVARGARFDFEVVTRQLHRLLRTAVASGEKMAVRRILETGMAVEWRDSGGRTALHWMVWYRDIATAEVLLDAGADPRIVCSEGSTALHYLGKATERRWDVNVERLLDRMVGMGLDLNARDAEGRTALHVAAVRGRDRKELLQWLLAREDVEKDVVDKSGKRWQDLLASLRVAHAQCVKNVTEISSLIIVGPPAVTAASCEASCAMGSFAYYGLQFTSHWVTSGMGGCSIYEGSTCFCANSLSGIADPSLRGLRNKAKCGMMQLVTHTTYKSTTMNKDSAFFYRVGPNVPPPEPRKPIASGSPAQILGSEACIKAFGTGDATEECIRSSTEVADQCVDKMKNNGTFSYIFTYPRAPELEAQVRG